MISGPSRIVACGHRAMAVARATAGPCTTSSIRRALKLGMALNGILRLVDVSCRGRFGFWWCQTSAVFGGPRGAARRRAKAVTGDLPAGQPVTRHMYLYVE